MRSNRLVSIIPSVLCPFLLVLGACTEVGHQKPMPSPTVVVDERFPPEGANGTPDSHVALEKTDEVCGVSIKGNIWRVKNKDPLNRDITLHVQVDSNEAPEFYPQWITLMVPGKSTIDIPPCDKAPNGSQSFYFSIGGEGWRNSPAWPQPNGITAMHAAYIKRNYGVTWLINRHHKRPISVQYQLVGQPRQTLRLEPLEYQPIGTVEAVIHTANYS
ncbi:MAG: hypothetical protein JJE16_00120 [Nitrospiraceae bacterium]|nr:hypothetical protein [Nitrospiraceae bacterium]